MSSEGESRSTPTALQADIDSERCNGEAGPHAALQQYAQLDRRVRAALDLPALPDAPNPDAFALAHTVAYLFQRFLNACAEAGVDSSAPWIKAVAEAEEAMTADKDPTEPQALDQSPTPSHSPAQELEGELAAAARSPIPSVANAPDSAPNASTPGREASTTALANPSPSGQSDSSSSTQADPSPSTQADPSPSTQANPSSSTSTSTQSSTSTSQSTSTSTSQSTSTPTPTSTSTSTPSAPVPPTIDAARPHIRALLSAPDVDWTTLSTKDVRARLVARGVGFDAAWVWERRRELRTVIEEEFDAAHTRWQAAQAAANHSAASPSQSGPAASGDSTAPPPPQLEASSSGDASSSHAAQHTENRLEAVGPSVDTPTKRRSIAPPRRSSSHSSQTHAEDGPVAPSAEDQAVAPIGSAEAVAVAPVGSAADEAVASAVAAEHEDVAPDAADVDSAPTKRAKKRKVVSLLKSKLEPTSPIPRSTRSSTRRNLKGLSVLSRIQQYENAVRSLPAQQGPNSPSSAATSGTGIKLRIPSLAARQAKSASKSPLPATSPKRKRSPTPDSDEDEFAASFMRKRKVSAAAV